MDRSEELYYSLVTTNLLLADGDRQFFQQYGLSQVRFFALRHIARETGLSLSELSRRLLCTKGNATRILKSMEDEGLILRQIDPKDNRLYHLELTDAGMALLTSVEQEYQQYNQQRFAFLASSADSMLQSLNHLNEHIKQMLTEKTGQENS